jgi:hypothetical protein
VQLTPQKRNIVGASHRLALVVALALSRTPIASAASVPSSESDVVSRLRLSTVSRCFDRESLAEEVAGWLERNTVDSRVSVRVSGVEGDLSFTIAMNDEPPLVHRFADLPADCSAQRSAVALSIALAIDAVAPASNTGRPTERWTLSGNGMVTTPFPEHPAVGGNVTLGLELARWLRTDLAVLALFARDQSVRSDVAARFDVRLTAVRADACYLPGWSKAVTFGLCAGPWLGALTSVGHDTAAAQTQTNLFWAVEAALDADVALTRVVAIHARASLAVAGRGARVQVTETQSQTGASRDLPQAFGAFELGPSFSF